MEEVRHWMIKKVHRISEDKRALDAARLMARYNIGVLPVISDKFRVAGIVSERDILQKIVAVGEDAKKARVKDIMTRKIVTVSSSSTILDAIKKMDKHHIRHTPVVDGTKLVGLLSLRQVIEKLTS